MGTTPNPLAEMQDELGLTRTQFAALVGFSEAYIGKLERREREVTDSVVMKIARALGWKVEKVDRKLRGNGATA